MADISVEEINRLLSIFGDLSGASADVARTLIQVSQLNQTQLGTGQQLITAERRKIDLARQQEEREIAIAGVFKTLSSTMVSTIQGFTSVTSQLYASTNAFQSAQIGVDGFSSVMKSLLTVLESGSGLLGLFSRSVGFGLSIFTKVVNSGLDIAVGVIKFRLEAAKTITDLFVNLNKQGAMFGGNLNLLLDSAKESGINLQEFGRFVQSSIEALSGFGGTIAQSAVKVGNLTNRIAEVDEPLLAMYGSFQSLAEATAQYMNLQKRLGQSEIANTTDQATAVSEYLRNQRLLTELTGKNVQEQQREIERRRTIAAYTEALRQEEDQTTRNQIEFVVGLAGEYGPKMQQAIQDFYQNNGQLINEQSITTARMNKPVFDMLSQMLAATRQAPDQFKSSMGSIAQASRDGILSMQTVMSETGMFMLNASRRGGAVLDIIGEVGGNVRRVDAAISKLPETLDRFRFEQEGAKAGSAFFTGAIREQNNLQKEIDAAVRDQLGSLPDIVSAAMKLNSAFIKAQTGISEVVNALLGKGPALADALENFKNQLEKAFEALLGSNNQNRPTQPLPGIGTPGAGLPGPVLASARIGISADNISALVASLAQDRQELPTVQPAAAAAPAAATTVSVPAMNLDPLLAALQEQTTLNTEIRDQLRDSNDIQRRIYQATV